jgi:hypothetical protein
MINIDTFSKLPRTVTVSYFSHLHLTKTNFQPGKNMEKKSTRLKQYVVMAVFHVLFIWQSGWLDVCC